MCSNTDHKTVVFPFPSPKLRVYAINQHLQFRAILFGLCCRSVLETFTLFWLFCFSDNVRRVFSNATRDVVAQGWCRYPAVLVPRMVLPTVGWWEQMNFFPLAPFCFYYQGVAECEKCEYVWWRISLEAEGGSAWQAESVLDFLMWG